LAKASKAARSAAVQRMSAGRIALAVYRRKSSLGGREEPAFYVALDPAQSGQSRPRCTVNVARFRRAP
jgi:hypothetical protein